jgi:hypothetical protein
MNSPWRAWTEAPILHGANRWCGIPGMFGRIACKRGPGDILDSINLDGR